MLHAEGSVYTIHCGGGKKEVNKGMESGENEHGKVWGEEEEASFSERKKNFLLLPSLLQAALSLASPQIHQRKSTKNGTKIIIEVVFILNNKKPENFKGTSQFSF